MTLTEEEAKTKWCPFARVGVSENVSSHSANRTPLGGVDGLNNANLCIGSDCMAWRPVVINEMTEVVFAGTREGKPGAGFCGLAGEPR